MYSFHRHCAKLEKYQKFHCSALNLLFIMKNTTNVLVQLKTHLEKSCFFDLDQFSDKSCWRAAQMAVLAPGQGVGGGQSCCFCQQCLFLLA